ncbi:class I adenylate-forming enzyme family protein [Amycolatopsis sp. NPDC003676]
MAEPFVAVGPPLPPECPDGQAGGLLAEAARRWPDRPAIVAGDRTATFAELDAAADRFSRCLGDRLGSAGAAVAVTSSLDIDFAVAYYGVLRSGNVVAPLNPLLPPPVIAHNLASVSARLAVVSPEVAERIAQVRAQLPDLEDVLPLSDVATFGGEAVAAEIAADAPACLLFTSGTTGAPKAVRLSHRNITINAAQVRQAHHLGPDAVCVVNLPTYHPMHLNPALLAGATQILCPRPSGAVELAIRYGATHFYSMPAWLTRLAATDTDTAVPSLRMIASGGSALPSDAAETLTVRFGTPVFQGYGLAETSPLTHSDRPDAPVTGSVGFPVAGTECDVVDTGTGARLAAGEAGEVRVRGPQVMLGYHGRPDGEHLEAGGWFRTGDIGRISEDGRLVLVDRIKDVFKRDNWLVSPSAIERRLRAHGEVEDCVVVDVADRVAGAVAAAFVVLRAPAAEADLIAFANREAPAYEHLEFVEVLTEIPRSANGKVQRKELRAEMARRRGALTGEGKP